VAWLLGIGLTAVAGYVDAVGVLAFGGLFIAFMSGNTTRLGIGLVEDGRAAAMSGALVILAFVAGAVLGALLRASAGPRFGRTLILLAEAGVLAIAAAMLGNGAALAASLPMAAAMGMHNLCRQPIRSAQLGGTFITGTLVALGQGIADRMLGRRAGWPVAEALHWTVLLAGIAAGTAMTRAAAPAAALALPCAALPLLAAMAGARPASPPCPPARRTARPGRAGPAA
jgi:uncharacterized membrane protein YoaK (UPF0700 family)